MIQIEFASRADAELLAEALLIVLGRGRRRYLSLEQRSRANELSAEIRDGVASMCVREVASTGQEVDHVR